MRENSIAGRLAAAGWRATVVALLATAISSAAAAQGTASRIDPYPGAVEEVEDDERATARRAMATFARCVARSRPRTAEAILALPTFSREQFALTRRRIGGFEGCMGASGAELRLPPMLLVGALAEGLLLSRYEEADLAAISDLDDERLSDAGLDPRSGYEDVALCIVRRDPAAALDLVRSQPAGEDERPTIARIVPRLGPCLPQGLEFRFNREAVRSLVAVGLYRILSVTSPR